MGQLSDNYKDWNALWTITQKSQRKQKRTIWPIYRPRYWTPLTVNRMTGYPFNIWPLAWQYIGLPKIERGPSRKTSVLLYNTLLKIALTHFEPWGARWLSGRVSDSGARGPGFETYRRRVVSLSKTLYSPKVLVNYPGSDGSVPTWLKNCWLGR